MVQYFGLYNFDEYDDKPFVLWTGLLAAVNANIVDILKRFHVHKFSFTTDICKMYRQVLILPKYYKF